MTTDAPKVDVTYCKDQCFLTINNHIERLKAVSAVWIDDKPTLSDWLDDAANTVKATLSHLYDMAISMEKFLSSDIKEGAIQIEMRPGDISIANVFLLNAHLCLQTLYQSIHSLNITGEQKLKIKFTQDIIAQLISIEKPFSSSNNVVPATITHLRELITKQG